MTNALVGHTGFVGGNLSTQHKFDAQYNSKNIHEIDGMAFDALVFAGARAEKWKANADPEGDRAGINNAVEHVKRASAKRLILISTIDVLPPQPGLDEDFDCSTIKTHAYGANRFYIEEALSEAFEKVHIIRLPGLFGPGLKKNIIFDLLNQNMLEKINPESAYQFYDLTRLWSDIELALQHDIRLTHLFPAPIKTQSIIDRFFPGAEVGADRAPKAEYEYRTKYAELFGGSDGYIYDAEEGLARIGSYIHSQQGKDSA